MKRPATIPENIARESGIKNFMAGRAIQFDFIRRGRAPFIPVDLHGYRAPARAPSAQRG
jgi:hypothetical protein